MFKLIVIVILAFAMAFRSASYSDEGVFPLNMGEEAAFERIFHLYHAPLRYFCEELTGTDDACEDIVSELFVALWRKQVIFESAEHAQAYLYRSARNGCLNFIRGSKRAAEKEERIIARSTEISGDYLDTIIRTEVWAELYRAIEGLPSQCCKVITLSYLEGMTNQEVADELGLSLKTVKNHKLRALGILKDNLPDAMIALLVTAALFK